MKRVFLLVLLTLGLSASDLTLEIVKEVGNEPKIAVENGTTGVESRLDKKFFKLIIGDLTVTSHFNVDDKERRVNFDDAIDQIAYRDKEYLLRYKLFYDDRGRLGARVFLFDLAQNRRIFEKSYTVSDRQRYPFIAHKIVYDINKVLNFPDVSFLRSFVIFSKYTGAKRADIVVSDYTLTYQKTIVSGGLNLFPKWASKEQRAFYYTDMSGEKPTLYRVDLYQGTRKKIISSPGMLVCSDVSEDGKQLLLTMAPGMQPDIYLYDLPSGRLERVTYYRGIDVNGNFTEGGRKIVFVSDRLGYPTIFAKEVDSRAVERLVYHGRNNSSCTTSGNYVVYSSRETNNAFGRNTFNLYLISTTSDYIRRLTANGVNIFPRFAPDGETLLFIKEYANQTGLGVLRLRYNKSYIYPLYTGKIQSIDW
ncbi:MAG: Tol-Pal system protein TolB [Epsilonproteobacteria bacterium]|nr:Tol-Pal system protein TolB [Campylobacterota bacterium]NPA56682.1 Tol-Pal system protein TolB [Campylobacterota bacterium]